MRFSACVLKLQQGRQTALLSVTMNLIDIICLSFLQQNCLMNNEVSRMDRGFVHKNLMIDSSEQVVYFFRDLRYQFVSRKFFSDD